MKLEVNIEKRYAMAIISSAIVVFVVALGVYALGAGQVANPGHSTSQLGAPAGCATGQFLQWSGNDWICADSGVAGGVGRSFVETNWVVSNSVCGSSVGWKNNGVDAGNGILLSCYTDNSNGDLLFGLSGNSVKSVDNLTSARFLVQRNNGAINYSFDCSDARTDTNVNRPLILYCSPGKDISYYSGDPAGGFNLETDGINANTKYKIVLDYLN